MGVKPVVSNTQSGEVWFDKPEPNTEDNFKDEYIFGCLCAPQSVTLDKYTVVFSQYNAVTKCRSYKPPQ